MKKLVVTLAVLTGLFMAGCATPETRIRDNPAAFDRATPEQQQLIKQGKVALGFDEEMVQLALGRPDRMREKIDAKGRSVIWTYVEYDSDGSMVYYHGWYHHGWWGGPYVYYPDIPYRYNQRERSRIVFREGRVVSIEQET
jgi:hypothetical protein